MTSSIRFSLKQNQTLSRLYREEARRALGLSRKFRAKGKTALAASWLAQYFEYRAEAAALTPDTRRLIEARLAEKANLLKLHEARANVTSIHDNLASIHEEARPRPLARVGA